MAETTLWATYPGPSVCRLHGCRAEPWIWFAIHTVFREVELIRIVPAFRRAEIVQRRPGALASPAVAIFRFVGMIPTLIGCCAAGSSVHGALSQRTFQWTASSS
jgi:hypothetical protein